MRFFLATVTTTLTPPPPPSSPPLRYSKRSTIHILQCSRTAMCHLEDLFSHLGARPNANVTMISHGCHGGPFSFLLVSWFINVSQRLSVFKVASASKYSKCQWALQKIYFPLFVCLIFQIPQNAESALLSQDNELYEATRRQVVYGLGRSIYTGTVGTAGFD